MANYMRKDKVIAEHNASESNFKLGHNKLSDWTQEELKTLNGYKEPENPVFVNFIETPVFEGDLPDSVNWNNLSTPIKDQGQCGSCWTFATMESVETNWILTNGKWYTLSTQQLVDCVNADAGYPDSAGCDGGWTYDAYDYLTHHHAIQEFDYPYTAVTGDHCQYREHHKSEPKLNGFVWVDRNPTAMKQAVATTAVAVSIQADQDIFHNYVSGVIDSTACGTETDHAVVVNGYGTDADTGLEYWLVRNSWGADWGDNGYVRIAITDEPAELGICGIMRRPLMPVPHPGPW
jgi:C1A family cysteine protease